MNAPEPKATTYVTLEKSLLRRAAEAAGTEEEDLDGGWFVRAAPESRRPSERPKTVPPTGDDEIDRWLR
jgi:hypothetical protein